ncbi:MAG TPA: 30S ribosome-binding factor RbfA [Acidimicrobiales bacterium]|nr:30S ribosome-binding factor RbfA [Acidimicrobiales bacterium]
MPDRRYPRTARVNQVLREVVADALERVSDEDERLLLVTVTSIEADADLRHARVFYASRQEGVQEALDEQRVRLQAAIGHQVRLKRTPQLSFVADPAISSGEQVESILRAIQPHDPD